MKYLLEQINQIDPQDEDFTESTLNQVIEVDDDELHELLSHFNGSAEDSRGWTYFSKERVNTYTGQPRGVCIHAIRMVLSYKQMTPIMDQSIVELETI